MLLSREQYESEKLLEEEWRRFENEAAVSMELAQKIWNKTVQRAQVAQVDLFATRSLESKGSTNVSLTAL